MKRLAFLRGYALAETSWRALSAGLGPIDPKSHQFITFCSARALGLIRAR